MGRLEEGETMTTFENESEYIRVKGKTKQFIEAQDELMKHFNMTPKEWNKYVSPVIILARETLMQTKFDIIRVVKQ
jgi:hypothetical protein